MIGTPVTRRAMLGAVAAAGVAAAAIPLARSATGRRDRPWALLDPDLGRADLRSARAMLRAHDRQLLDRDLVWHWRRELRERFAAGEQAVALVRWDKAFVLAGLAREEGLAVQQVRIARSMFRIDIG